jgi:hypothetical protein
MAKSVTLFNFTRITKKYYIMSTERFGLSEVRHQSPEIYDIFNDHNDAILVAIAKINKVLPEDFKINADCFFEVKRTDIDDYKNDGNTKTKGFGWSAYWAFPVNGHKKSEYSIGAIQNQYCPEAVVFVLDNFNERCSDGRISGCKFFSLYFIYDSYSEVVNSIERGANKNCIRLDYINNNYQPMAILKPENYAKIYTCMTRLKLAVDTCNLFR